MTQLINPQPTINSTRKEFLTMATITINFFDCNDNLTTFAAEAGETLAQILEHQDVIDYFENSDAEPGTDIEDYIVEINDADVEDNPTVIRMLLRAAVQNGDSISFAFEAGRDDAEQLDNAVNGNDAAGAEGVVIVSIAGGLQTARINITNGVTTLQAVIFNDTVRARSGMTDTQLRDATVSYKGRIVSYNEMSAIRVSDADIVELAPRVAATKG